LRVALIGVTGYGFHYFEDLNKLVAAGRVRWAAVTIINPEAAVKQTRYFSERGVPVYGDYRVMLRKEQGNIDWVCIPTGIGWHQRMTLDALELGLQVLVEKPLAPTLQDVGEIEQAERDAGIHIGVGFQHTFLDETWEIKERLLGGEIGKVDRIDCLALWPRSQRYYDRNDWAGRLHHEGTWILDSPLHNGLAHMVNLILFWSGDSLGESGLLRTVGAELYRAKPIESFDTIRTVAEMENGIKAGVVLTHSSHHNFDPEVRITGTRGSLLWRYCGHHTFTTDRASSVLTTPTNERVREIMFERMADHLEGKAARICTSEMARGTCKWVNAVHDAAPIRDIPAAHRECITDHCGDSIDTIPGIEYYAMRAYKECRSFSELEAPWAGATFDIDVRKYNAFQGGHCAGSLEMAKAPRRGRNR